MEARVDGIANLDRLAKTFVGRPPRGKDGAAAIWLNDAALVARARVWIEVLRSNSDLLRAYAPSPFGQRMAWTLGKAADAVEWGLACKALIRGRNEAR